MDLKSTIVENSFPNFLNFCYTTQNNLPDVELAFEKIKAYIKTNEALPTLAKDKIKTIANEICRKRQDLIRLDENLWPADANVFLVKLQTRVNFKNYYDFIQSESQNKIIDLHEKKQILLNCTISSIEKNQFNGFGENGFRSSDGITHYTNSIKKNITLIMPNYLKENGKSYKMAVA